LVPTHTPSVSIVRTKTPRSIPVVFVSSPFTINFDLPRPFSHSEAVLFLAVTKGVTDELRTSRAPQPKTFHTFFDSLLFSRSSNCRNRQRRDDNCPSRRQPPKRD